MLLGLRFYFLKTFMSVFTLFVSMVKSNVLDVNVVKSTTSSVGTLTVNLSVTSGSGVTQIDGVYYLSPEVNGYYTCGLQMNNQSVRYSWTLNVSATPTSLQTVQPCLLKSPTLTPTLVGPTIRRLTPLHSTLTVRIHRSSPHVWFRLRYSQSPRWV